MREAKRLANESGDSFNAAAPVVVTPVDIATSDASLSAVGRISAEGTRPSTCGVYLLGAVSLFAAFAAGMEFGVRAATSPSRVLNTGSWLGPSASGAGTPVRGASDSLICPTPAPAALSGCPLLVQCTPVAPSAATSMLPSVAPGAVVCPSSPFADGQLASGAVCPADALREPGSLTWGSQHWCPEMDTGGSWTPLNEMFVPLVPYGLDTRNDSAVGARIYYGPEGLIHENNAPGGGHMVRQQEPELVGPRKAPCALC